MNNQKLNIVLILLLVFSLQKVSAQDFSTPKSVIETFYSAIQERNLDVIAQCIHPESNQRKALNYYSKNTSELEIKNYESKIGEFYGVSEVLEKNDKTSLGWILVKVEFYSPTGELKVYRIYVKKHDMGYRIIQF